MALIELNLEKPALKRTETEASSTKKSTPSGEPTTEKSETDAATTVEVPEGEPAEEESSGGVFRRIAVLAATVGAVFAVRRWRSRRKQSGERAEFEEEWETPRSE